MWHEPAPDEIRRSGYALVPSPDGYTQRVPSCRPCAKAVGAVWLSAFYEGSCQGCECILSGFPIPK